MKKVILPALIATILSLPGLSQKDKDKPRIEGSGNVITKEFAVKSFDELSSNGVFHLQLSQSDKEQVKIEADDNLMDLFIVENDGSTLKIHMKKDVNIQSKNKMKVYVSFKNLKSMNLSMVGSTSSDEQLKFKDLKLKNQSVGGVNLKMNLNNLDLENGSVGTMKLTGTAENAVIKSNGVGSIQAGDFVVQKMDIDNNGVGSATLNAAKELKVKESFLGKVINKGGATAKKVNKQVI